MKKLTYLFVIVLMLNFTTGENAIGQMRWPIDNSTSQNADVITSAFGPRVVNGNYQIHYGLDTDGSNGQNVYSPSEFVVVGDIRNSSDPTEGWVVTLDVWNEQKNAFETLLLFHSDTNPVNYGLQVEDTTYTFDDIIYKVGTGGGAFGSHLHTAYIPKDYPSSGGDYSDAYGDIRELSVNPINLFNHSTGAYSVDNFKVHNDDDAWLEFELLIPKDMLDFNRLELYLTGPTVDGFTIFAGDLVDSQNGYMTLSGRTFDQEIGVIDLDNRIGYDFGDRVNSANNKLFNGVRITPSSYPPTSGSNHKYKIEFKLDESIAEELVGGLKTVYLYLSNSSDHSPSFYNLNTISVDIEGVAWLEKWPYDTYFSQANSDIHVIDGGKILILNENSSKTTQTTLPYGKTIRIQDGGKFEMEAGAGIGSRTYFTHEGDFYVDDGGQIILGENTWFTNDGGYFEASFNSLAPLTGDVVQSFLAQMMLDINLKDSFRSLHKRLVLQLAVVLLSYLKMVLPLVVDHFSQECQPEMAQ